MERLIFANLSYDSPGRTSFRGKIQSGFIYTMGLPYEMLESFGYQRLPYALHQSSTQNTLNNHQIDNCLPKQCIQNGRSKAVNNSCCFQICIGSQKIPAFHMADPSHFGELNQRFLRKYYWRNEVIYGTPDIR